MQEELIKNIAYCTFAAEGTAIVLLVAAIIRYVYTVRPLRKGSAFFIGYMCATILLAVVDIGTYWVWMKCPENKPPYMILQMICDVIRVFLVVTWLVAIEYFIDRSVDIIKRHILGVITPALIALVFMIGYDLIELYLINNPLTEKIFIRGQLFIGIDDIIEVGYLMFAYYLLYKARQKRNGLAQLMLATPFVLPVILGVAITQTTYVSVCALGFSIGIWAMDISLTRRRQCFDEETGFYKREYFEFLKKFEKDGVSIGDLVLVFQTQPEHLDELGSIINGWVSLNSKVVRINEQNCYVILSPKQSDEAARQLIEFVEKDAEESGISVKSSYTSRKIGDADEDVEQRLVEGIRQIQK